MTNSGAASIQASIRGSSTSGTVVSTDAVLTPTANTWYKMSKIISPTDGAGQYQLRINQNYVDAATANGKVMEVDGNYGVKVVNLTAIAKQAATLSQADAMLLDYFSGTQSAVTGRVRSVNRNHFDGILETGTLDASGVNAVDATKIRSKNYTKVKPTTAYIFSNGSSYTALTASYYTKDKVFLSQSAVNYATFTTPALTHFIRFQTTGTNISANIQLELGTTATTFIAHAKTESYTKPMPLYRVPNGVADTVENGRYVKRVQRYVLQSGDINTLLTAGLTVDYVGFNKSVLVGNSTGADVNASILGRTIINGFTEYAGTDFDNAANAKTFSLRVSGTKIYIFAAKGTYANLAAAQTALAGTVIYYQLATPVITENVSSGTLLAYPSGTVYWEPVIADVAIYATGASILNTGYPISSLESIYKIDLVTGEQTPLAVASATVASGGLSFTHTGLSNGDMLGV